MNWFKQNWWKLLCFTAFVACLSTMDHLNFHVPHDSGWWSLHTEGYRGFGGDGWHTLKYFAIGFVILGMTGKDSLKYYVALSFAILNLITHKIFFRGKK
jgi:hypothetical protein